MPIDRPFVIISLRYSLLVRNSISWLIAKNRPFDTYKDDLFNPDRLATRHYLFSRITIPSLAMQNPPIDPTRHRLYIFTSSELPAPDRAALDSTVAHLPWAEVVTLKEDEAAPYAQCTLDFLKQQAGESALYAHCRLDDDDGLSSDFLQRLSQYIRPEFSDWGVSFAYGITACFDTQSKSFTGFYERHADKTAIGLARIGIFERSKCTAASDVKTIFRLGNHKTIDRKAPTILDSRQPAYVRVTHAAQDFRPRRGIPATAVDIGAFAEHFPYLSNGAIVAP